GSPTSRPGPADSAGSSVFTAGQEARESSSMWSRRGSGPTPTGSATWPPRETRHSGGCSARASPTPPARPSPNWQVSPQRARASRMPVASRPPPPTADESERRRRLMSEAFYSHARLYDLMFPGGGPAVDFYRAVADRQGGSVLELGCGTGHKLIPIASDGHPCVGLDFSSDMLAEAQRKANERGAAVEWMQGDMRAFDLGRTFDFVFITANSLLHLHEAEDLVSCFRSVRRHLAPGARFVFDVFNPSVRQLAEADGVRRTRESLSFMDPDRGNVSVDVAEIYDAPAQVTRGTWHLSTNSEPDFVVVPLEI